MPRYRFTAPWPAVFTDLRHGVNATVTPADGADRGPDGSTVELHPGDEVTVDRPYPHAWLDQLPDPAPAPTPAPTPAPQAQPAAPAPAPAATPQEN